MKTSNFKFQIILAVLLLILGFRFFFFYHNKPEYKEGQSVRFETVLSSEPKMQASYQTFSAEKDNFKLVVRTSLYPRYHYKDRLKISGNISFSSAKSSDFAFLHFPKITKIEKETNIFLSFADAFRGRIIFLFQNSLPDKFSGLMLGIVFGIKSSIPSDFKENLTASGVAHVIAASGMNITIIGSFFSSVFGFFLKRRSAILASIAVIVFYAFLAGFEASIVRASIMGILVFSAQILGRQSLASYGLFTAGFLMLFVSPGIVSDIGFQLSFAATAGLLYIKPIFDNKKKLKKFLEKSLIGEDAVTTIVAQIATLPIIIANFGAYSLWSIAVNGLVLWTVPILMIIGGAAVFLGIVFEPLGIFVLYSAIPLLMYFEAVVNFFSGLKGIFEIKSISWHMVIGYYFMLIALIMFLRAKKHG